MSKFFPANTRVFTATALLILTLGLSGCGGGDSDSGSTGNVTSGGGGTGSSSSNCNYEDLIKPDERSKANSCGIQVSGNYGMADSHLQQVIAACKLGEKAKADAHYNDVYKKAVQYAKDVSKTLSCGSGSNTALPNTSTKTYFNMCGKVSATQRFGSCYGPVLQGEGGCGNVDGYTYMSQHSSSSACVTARDSWLKSK